MPSQSTPNVRDGMDTFIHEINMKINTMNQSTSTHNTYIIRLARFERKYALPSQPSEPAEPADSCFPPLSDSENDDEPALEDLPPIDAVGDYITSL
jgi:hypothetical protein